MNNHSKFNINNEKLKNDFTPNQSQMYIVNAKKLD